MKTLNITREDVSSLFPTLPRRMNKGDAGRVLCICGSYEPCGAAMCGAAYFSAAAAYKCGSGIVEIFTHRKNYESLASLIPEAVFTLYDTEKETNGEIIARLINSIKKADSIVLGCGLGKSELARSLVKTTLESVSCPLVIDADGLNIISEDENLWSLLSTEQRKKTVVTPHPGEMSRLTGKTIPEILADTTGTAISFSKKTGIICLLKDNKTVITDGETVFVNQSGNAGMATAGMGDVLSGIIGGLLCRNTLADSSDPERIVLCSALYRAAAAAYIHGLSGDIASKEVGEYSLMASDVLWAISAVIKE